MKVPKPPHPELAVEGSTYLTHLEIHITIGHFLLSNHKEYQFICAAAQGERRKSLVIVKFSVVSGHAD